MAERDREIKRFCLERDADGGRRRDEALSISFRQRDRGVAAK
jgi:hypothetical protein